ncbi:putative protein phosphatase 2C 1 [Bienertia sinuspersici]
MYIHSPGSQGDISRRHDSMETNSKSFVSHDFTVDDATFCGVFDGHMPHGDLVARRVRDALPLKLLSFLNSCQTKEVVPSGACCNGDLKCDDSKVERDSLIEDQISLSWRDGSNLFMGNIGDSRAIMGSKDSNDSFVQAERIKRCKGRVFALQDELEVPKVWVPFDDAPGLAMARAFGDFCLNDYGVISVPEFNTGN